MISKWYESKDKAILLRKSGFSIRTIELKLGIPKSTLSGWFKDVEVNHEKKKILLKKWKLGLSKAREKAIVWHNSQKRLRIEKAQEEALEVFKSIPLENKAIIELSLSMLYLGEGSKSTLGTSIGNTSTVILLFFLSCMFKIYGIKQENVRCELHLRSDQDADCEKKYWSKILSIPLTNFTTVSFDKRTKGIKTYNTYHGVCVLKYGRSDIQRRLMNLARLYCEKI